MFNMLLLAIFVLAIWRLTNLLVFEGGPFDVFIKIRKLAGILEEQKEQDGYFAELLSCYLCTSLMLCLIFWPFYLYNPEIFCMIAAPFAAGSCVIFLYKLVDE